MLLEERIFGSAVKVNGLYVPAREVVRHFAKFCTRMALTNDHETYAVMLRGSATLLSYRNRKFLVATRHQIADAEFERVCVVFNRGDEVIATTSGGARWFSEKGDGDYYELVSFDFTEPWAAGSLKDLSFYDFRNPPPTVPADKVPFIVTYGYPFEGQGYEVDENDKLHVGSVTHSILCKYYGPSHDEALYHLKPNAPLDYDPDGFSGGAAFCTILGAEGFEAYFSGIVVRAGRDDIYLIKAGAVKAFLDDVIDA